MLHSDQHPLVSKPLRPMKEGDADDYSRGELVLRNDFLRGVAYCAAASVFGSTAYVGFSGVSSIQKDSFRAFLNSEKAQTAADQATAYSGGVQVEAASPSSDDLAQVVKKLSKALK